MTDELIPESPTIPIQVVTKQGQSRVIQWHDGGGRHRCILPAEVVREALMEGGLTEEELERGITYGEDWALMLEGVEMPTQETVAQALRDAGIWTAEEARASLGVVRSALTALYAPVTTAILRESRCIQKRRR